MCPNPDRPSAWLGTPDLELLQKFEPVAVYTRGEQFYPMEVETYIRECSLWEHHRDGSDELLVRQGELTAEKLSEPREAEFGSVRYLRFIEPLSLAESAQALADQITLRRRLRHYFRAGIGRLARGGILPRLLDGLFSLSFLLRGKVSAATAAAAEIDFNEMTADKKQHPYYGRVTRQNGWTILQYWFFYCFNSWRSGFHGVNDHESDWEMVSVYLYEQDDRLIPEWVAYASHDFKGDDLRRRWDDHEELKIEEESHPVVFVGAGSHASYFRRGEYQAEVNLPTPGWLAGLIQGWNRFWTETLGQPRISAFHIPFVDFARGDGLHIGAGETQTWAPVLIDESTPWVGQYRGLWGLFARDPISGENAPAGPMYNRDGSPRGSWYDPLGFAGLDKVPPPPRLLQMVIENYNNVTLRQTEMEALIPKKAEELQTQGARLKSMQGNPHLAKQYAALEKEINSLSGEVRSMRREYSENSAVLQGLNRRLEQLKAGRQDDPHQHIRHLAKPDDNSQVLRFDRAAETWAAISLSLLMFILAAMIFFTPRFLWVGLVIILILFAVAESFLRGTFVQTVGKITLFLAVISLLILLVHFWKWILVAVLLAIGISLMYNRLRELTH